jgi:predicted nucleic acid-binding protein
MTGASISTVFYLDASALVKRYVMEIGSAWVEALCRPTTGHTIATVRITKAEAAAAFARKLRDGGLAPADYANALRDLAHDVAYQYVLVDADEMLVDLAVDLTKRQKLRGYDAIQLATALTLNGLLTQASFPPLTFVCADEDLIRSAQGEGLATDNPNLHP